MSDDEAAAVLRVARTMHEEAARLGEGAVADGLEESARRLIELAEAPA